MGENSTETVATLCYNCGNPIVGEQHTTDDGLVCESCQEDNYWYCDDCNTYHNNNDKSMYSVDDGDITTCERQDYYMCNDCGNYFSEENIALSDSRRNDYICHHCKEYRHECHDCGRLVHENDACRNDNQQERYCDGCNPGNEEEPDNATGEIEITRSSTISISQDEVELGSKAADMLDDFYNDSSYSFYSDDKRFEYGPIKDYLLEGKFEINKGDMRDIFNRYKIISEFTAKDSLLNISVKLVGKVIVNEDGKTIGRLGKLLQKVIDGKENYFKPGANVTEAKSLAKRALDQLQSFQCDTYSFKLGNTIDLKLESMEASMDGVIGTCQTPDNVNSYALGYYDFIYNGCTMVLLIYDSNDKIVGRELVRYFLHDGQDNKGDEVLFFDRPYANGALANSKGAAIIEVIKQLPKDRFKVALPCDSVHDSSTKNYVFNDHLNNDTSMLEEITSHKNLRQPKRQLNKSYCAYYRDSYTTTYRYNGDLRNIVYDYCSNSKFNLYNII